MVSINDIKIPTEEEMEKRLLKRIEDSKDNINCFSNWYSSVVSKSIPSPASKVFDSLISTAKRYMEHEEGVFAKVTELRSQAKQGNALKGAISFNQDLSNWCVMNSSSSPTRL